MTLRFSSDESYTGDRTLMKLDDLLLTGYVSAFSLRSLGDSYTGPVIRLRRNSDNAEQDFTRDQINRGDAISFCGSSSGFIRKFYSLSGSTALEQANPSLQPSFIVGGVVNTANGRPSINFDGVDDFLSMSITLPQPFSVAVAGSAPTPKGDFSYVFESGGGGAGILPSFNSGSQVLYAGQVAPLAQSYSGGQRFVYAVAFNGASTIAFDAGGTEYDVNPGTAGLVDTLYVARNAGNSYYNLKLNELVLYNTAINKTKLSNIQKNINQYLGG